VNSARAIKGGDIEETATRTNLEAADEVARQARLRDLGGLIVIDFIDMEEHEPPRSGKPLARRAAPGPCPRAVRCHQQVRPAGNEPPAPAPHAELRVHPSPARVAAAPATSATPKSSALQILRIIQEESLKDNTSAVLAQVPVEVASFLLNEKRTEITKIELKQRISVLLVPNKSWTRPITSWSA
jgi:ribonuclease E